MLTLLGLPLEKNKIRKYLVLTLTSVSRKEIVDFDTIVRRVDDKLWLAHRHHRELKLQSFFMNSHKRSKKIS